MNIKYFGTPYGGYHIDITGINEKSIIYDFGIGLDASFPEELQKVTGCKAFLFDPTPEVSGYIQQHKEKWLFENYYCCGIGLQDGPVPFYHHKEPTFITHCVNPGGSWNNKPISTPVMLRRIDTIIGMLGHKGKEIEYIKLNLGGDFEYDAVNHIISCGVEPRQMAFCWFHMSEGKRKILMELLTFKKYRAISIDDNKKVTVLCK